MFSGYNLIYLIVVVLDVIALVKLLQSGANTGSKILWAILIILLPVLGMILYFLMGPGRNKAL